jgi:hypothetical protein
LTNVKKWHDLREEFSTGLLILVPPEANTWYKRLLLRDVPVYFTLVQAINLAVVLIREKILDRVLFCCKDKAPPELLLRLKYLETVDKIPSCQIVTVICHLATWPLATTTYVYCLRLLYESLICHSLIINQYCLTAVLRSI